MAEEPVVARTGPAGVHPMTRAPTDLMDLMDLKIPVDPVDLEIPVDQEVVATVAVPVDQADQEAMETAVADANIFLSELLGNIITTNH